MTLLVGVGGAWTAMGKLNQVPTRAGKSCPLKSCWGWTLEASVMRSWKLSQHFMKTHLLKYEVLGPETCKFRAFRRSLEWPRTQGWNSGMEIEMGQL